MDDDLDSIAFSRRNLQSWKSLGVLNADMSQYMESGDVWHESCFDADLSTGYLEDVLFEFSSKRRRLLMFAQQQTTQDYSDKNCWASDIIQNYCQEFGNLSQVTKCDTISDTKTPEEAVSDTYDSSSSSQKSDSGDSYHHQWTPDKENLYCIDPIFASGDNEKRKKRVVAKVVYPFALVKPGGFEGDATLNDINERILMPPTRPVRHPVGDYACRPLVSPEGPGLSGKAVVAFTRLHTHGRGTITIIRTRG